MTCATFPTIFPRCESVRIWVLDQHVGLCPWQLFEATSTAELGWKRSNSLFPGIGWLTMNFRTGQQLSTNWETMNVKADHFPLVDLQPVSTRNFKIIQMCALNTQYLQSTPLHIPKQHLSFRGHLYKENRKKFHSALGHTNWKENHMISHGSRDTEPFCQAATALLRRSLRQRATIPTAPGLAVRRPVGSCRTTFDTSWGSELFSSYGSHLRQRSTPTWGHWICAI